MVDLDFRLKMIYLKLELKVSVGCLFCDLIAWLPYTRNVNAEIIIVVTWSRSYRDLVTVELKIPQRYLYFFNRATFFEFVVTAM